jgi:hypothetical protein
MVCGFGSSGMWRCHWVQQFRRSKACIACTFRKFSDPWRMYVPLKPLTTFPATRRHMPEHPNPQLRRYEKCTSVKLCQIELLSSRHKHLRQKYICTKAFYFVCVCVSVTRPITITGPAYRIAHSKQPAINHRGSALMARAASNRTAISLSASCRAFIIWRCARSV